MYRTQRESRMRSQHLELNQERRTRDRRSEKKMLDLIIRGGQVVTPERVDRLDIGIEGERIATLAWPGSLHSETARIIDAAGKIVVPGGIEPHTHISIPVPQGWAGRPEVMTQPPEAASRAAAFGGVTTLIDFAGEPALDNSLPTDGGPRSILQRLDLRRAAFRGHCFIDFAFHYIMAGRVEPSFVGQIGEAIQEGIASFKIFTTFGPLRVPYGHLGAIFIEVAKHGGIMAVHAEDEEIVDYMIEKLKREGLDHGYNEHLAHNKLSEDLAFRRIIALARQTRTGVYFVHVTATEGVRAIAEARNQGLPVYGEALHNYLEFTCEDYRKPGGTAYHTYPALKFPQDRDALIGGLLEGEISTTATDEFTTHKDVKLWGKSLRTVCGGHNGIETRLPVAFTKLVVKRGMPLQRFAAITATNAAKILGLYPRKGVIAVGSDADLAVIDPSLRKTLTLSDLHSDSDYSIWEGFECLGYPVMTILRGKPIVENGKLFGSTSDGRWVARKTDNSVLTRPSA